MRQLRGLRRLQPLAQFSFQLIDRGIASLDGVELLHVLRQPERGPKARLGSLLQLIQVDLAVARMSPARLVSLPVSPDQRLGVGLAMDLEHASEKLAEHCP